MINLKCFIQNVEGNLLQISGEKKRHLEDKANWYHVETSTGPFSRSYNVCMSYGLKIKWVIDIIFHGHYHQLPADCDTTQVHAAYENGTLRLTIPKKPAEQRGKAIPIN